MNTPSELLNKLVEFIKTADSVSCADCDVNEEWARAKSSRTLTRSSSQPPKKMSKNRQ